MKKYTILIMTLLVSIQMSHAATFCVTTSAGLQAALNSANINNQHNLIKIANGHYIILGGFSFYYNIGGTNNGWDLEISGGWRDFLGSPCAYQFGSTPYSTVLNGNNINRVMQIQVSGNSDITISNLSFINGSVGSNATGGGLLIGISINNPSTGNLKLERTAFIFNEAGLSSAISISGFNKMIIRNNILAYNNALEGLTANIVQNGRDGIYFTNNTVINNTKDDVNSFGAGVRIFVGGSSKVAIYNNLLWDNETNDLQLSGDGEHYLSNNDIAVRVGVTPFSDTGNFSDPPDLATGSLLFMPSLNSPLVNAGKAPPAIVQIPTPFQLAWDLGVTDFNGDDRLYDTNVDIGAVEYSPESPIFINGFDSTTMD